MKFYLAHKRYKKAPINVDFQFRQDRFRLSTGVSTEISCWDNNKQRIKSSDIEFAYKNAKLDRIKSDLSNLISKSKYIDEGIAIEDFTKKVQNILKPSKAQIITNGSAELSSTLRSFFDKQKKMSLITVSTYKTYQSVCSFVDRFDEFKKKKHRLADINRDFAEDLKTFGHSIELSNTTLYSYLRTLRYFIKTLNKEGVNIPPVFTVDLVKNQTNNPQITLTDSQIEKILAFKPNSQSLQKAYDLFMVGLITGQRISDILLLSKMNIVHFDNESFLSLRQKKTNEPVYVPYTKEIEDIFSRYNGAVPNFSQSAYGRAIKRLFEEAGFDEQIERTKYIGKEVRKWFVPMHKVIASHAFRATNITLLARKGIGVGEIMSNSGHRDMTTVNKYLKQDNKEAAIRISNLMKGLI